MKTRANSYSRIMLSMIYQKAGYGWMKGPSWSWIMEKRRIQEGGDGSIYPSG